MAELWIHGKSLRINLPNEGQPGDIRYQIDVDRQEIRQAAEASTASHEFNLLIEVVLPERTVPGSTFVVLPTNQFVHSEHLDRLHFEPASWKFDSDNKAYRHFYWQVTIQKNELVIPGDIEDHTWAFIRPADKHYHGVREPIRELREIRAFPNDSVEFKVLEEPTPEYYRPESAPKRSGSIKRFFKKVTGCGSGEYRERRPE